MDLHNSTSTKLSFKHLKYDLPAGIVVFLVALPLCLGIAFASGAPLFSGIIAGIVGGVVVGLASGSAVSVSGPAAGLTVIVLGAIADLGGYDTFLLAVVIAGILQLIFGFLNAGIIALYFPSNVIKGMLAAIGIILIRKQILTAVGYKANAEGGFFSHFHSGALIISGVSLVILILWEQPFLKKFKFFTLVPAALFVVAIGVALNTWFASAFPHLYLGGDNLVALPVTSSPDQIIHHLTIPDFSQLGNYKVYLVAATIAIVASLESLLSIEAADKLDPFKRTTPPNRELKAQGLGNIFSGMIGGLPLTAVIVRSSANVNAGARTKMSSFFHGLLLLASVLALASVLNKIPLACLAALLLVIGYKLAKIPLFVSMYKQGWEQFLPFIVTIVAIQFSDLLKGIGVGMAVAIFFILRNNYKRATFISTEKKQQGEVIRIELAEEVSFLNKGSISNTLAGLPENSKVVIDGSKSHTIDVDVIEMIHDFKRTAVLKNIELGLIGIPEFKGASAH
jgi:MFS superfamily sulfate permease-like transporter